MARFNAKEIDNYGGQGGAGYFSLKNDKDTAQVRFMYNTVDDIEGFSVHEVEVDGKKRYVNCPRNYSDPLEKCPFCRDRRATFAKLFVPLYNEDEERIQIWERGKKFYAKLSSIFSRAKGDIVSNIYEIERNGRPGDQQTTYEVYQIENDGTAMEDLPELPEILGGLVLDKNAEEMEYYLKHDAFPSEETAERGSSRRGRRDARDSRETEREEPVSRRRERRTPANSGRRRVDDDDDVEEGEDNF